MPRYYFDFEDNDVRMVDDAGTELSGLAAVREGAIGVLPELARDRLPDGMHHRFKASVRDESGRVIFIAKMSMDAEWVEEQDPKKD